MKRIISLLLALTLALGVSASALGDSVNLSVRDPESGSDVNYNSVTAVGDTFWLLGFAYENDQLFLGRWKSGMTEMEQFTGDLLSSDRFSSAEEVEETPGGAHAIGALSSDGERLITVNPWTGLVFAIEAGEDGIRYTDICTITDTSTMSHKEEDWAYVLNPFGTAVCGDTLLWALSDWEPGSGQETRRLIRYSLKDGSVAPSALQNVMGLCAYRDGKALVALRDPEKTYDEETGGYTSPDIYVYDPADDSTQLLGKGPRNYEVRMAYSDTLDAVVWEEGGRVMGLNAQGELRQYAYSPISGPQFFQVSGENLLLGGWEGILVRELNPAFSAEDYVVTYGFYNSSARALFGDRYPDVPIYEASTDYAGNDKLLEGMKSGEMDVLSMSLSYGAYTALRDRGYCADLSGVPAIADAVSRMYPVYAAGVTDKQGRVVALPTQVWAWGSAVNRTVMQEMGLTEEDIPDNLVDLVDFLNRWDEDYGEEFSSYCPVEVYYDSAREMLFYEAMNMYLGWCTATGTQVKFDTPVFRQVMQAIEGLKWNGAQQDQEDEYIWREPLILLDGNQQVGSFNGSDEEYYYPLQLRLTPDTEYWVGAQVEVLIVNPWSKHQEAAANLLTCVLDTLNINTQYTLFSDKTEAVENPDYERMLADSQEWLENLRKQIEEAEEPEKSDLQAMLEEEEKYLERQKQYYRWSVTEEAVEKYTTKILPRIYLATPTFLSYSQDDALMEVQSLIQRYVDGQTGMEEFIRSVDQKLWMMQMENQ